jgi:hypothetical protein
LLVGGWAVGIYGHPRATKDIDFLVSSDKINLKKLQKAFIDFNAPPINIEEFHKKGNVIRIGNSPTQIDVINEADGININDCFPRKNIMSIDDIEIMLISKEDLINNKIASARYIDLADAEKLKKR